jgi:hypothetical protein
MFWNNLTQEEQDEYFNLLKRISEWVTYCEFCRAKKTRRPIDYSLNLPNEDYIRWDQLATKFWQLPSVVGAANSSATTT